MATEQTDESDQTEEAEGAEELPPDDGERLSAGDAARTGLRQVSELTGRQPEGVTALERTEQGWRVGVEVVETHRIPDSTDILAVYEAELDAAGELVSYRRTTRYARGRGDESGNAG